MKKIKDLEAEDFPNVDTGKFQEWKNAQNKFRIQSNYVSLIGWAGLLQLLIFREQLLSAMIFGISLIVVIAVSIPGYRKVNKIRKESGMTSKDIRKAKRN